MRPTQSQSDPTRLERLSLWPLTQEQALRAALMTPPLKTNGIAHKKKRTGKAKRKSK
jgi:hypothetical protein